MGSCEKCSAELAEDALFCPKCGVRTPRGKKEKAEIPWEESLAEVRKKIDEAMTVAFEEMQKGLDVAREEIRRTTSRSTVACPECGKASSTSAQFCWSCGKKLG